MSEIPVQFGRELVSLEFVAGCLIKGRHSASTPIMLDMSVLIPRPHA
ncbi:MAG: hypothetical protein ABIK89_24640 [Planctomycetota bacterium]